MATTERSYIKMLDRVQELLEEYKAEVEGSNLAPSSKKDYILFAEMFVKWMNGNFEPGSMV